MVFCDYLKCRSFPRCSLSRKISSSDGMADKCSKYELFTCPLKLAFDRGGIVSGACSATKLPYVRPNISNLNKVIENQASCVSFIYMLVSLSVIMIHSIFYIYSHLYFPFFVNANKFLFFCKC